MAFLLFLFAVEGAGTILGAWIVAKLAANWQRRELPKGEGEESRLIRARTFRGLMTGILSLGIGMAGGSLARCYLPLNEKESPSYCAFVKQNRGHRDSQIVSRDAVAPSLRERVTN
jgi:hypothetical protein